MIDYSLPSMLKNGFTEKYAKHYLQKKRQEESSGLFAENNLKDAYDKGFWVENYIQYLHSDYWNQVPEAFLTDYDYQRLWPLNDWMRIWINDKLTLKYMLSGTEHQSVMPKYYYYMSRDGLRSLIDNPNSSQSVYSLLELLKNKKVLATKPCNGASSVGFHKLSYDQGYYLDDQHISMEALSTFINQNPNYIYTEYLYPEHSLSLISNKVPTIRILVLNCSGNDPYILPYAYIRFGTENQGASNYKKDKQIGDYTIAANVNTETGVYANARSFYINKGVPVSEHPDTHVPIEGIIPKWKEVKSVILGVSKYLFGAEWIGFDACVDAEQKVRIMEINSHPGIGYIQAFYPLLLDIKVQEYFCWKLQRINDLSETELSIRNAIQR